MRTRFVSFLYFAPQVQGVLAPLQPLGPGPMLDPPGILQPPAGALSGVVQTPQPLGVLVPTKPLGTGRVLDPPGILQQPAVVVNTTRVQAGACYLGSSAYGSSSSSTDPTAWARTHQVST